VSLDNESSGSFSTGIITDLYLPTHPSSVLRTDTVGLVGGLGLTPLKRVRVTTSGNDLEVKDLDAAEIVSGTLDKDRLPATFNGPLTVQGATNTLAQIAVRSAMGDYGRFEMGTSGSGQWYLEKDTSGNLAFNKGAYGSGFPYWTFRSDGSARMRPATAAANVTTQIEMGIPSSTQYGQVWIQYQAASVPGGADDQIIFRGVQNGVIDSLPICRFQRTGVVMRKPTTCQDGLTIANDLICGVTCIANFNTSTNQLRFRPGGGGFSCYFNVSQPASANRVVNFIDPGAVNRTVLYTDLAQACTLGSITSSGTILFTGSSITLGDAAADSISIAGTSVFSAPASFTSTFSATGPTLTLGDSALDLLTVNATTSFTAPITFTTFSAGHATLTDTSNQLTLGGSGGTNTIILSAPTPAASRTVSFADPGASNRTLLYTDASQAATLGSVNATSLTTTGAVSVGTTLGVTGTSTLAAVNASSLTTTGAVTVGTTLGVTGTSTLAAVNASSLTTTGAVSVGTTLGVTGTSTLASVGCTALTASGAVSFTRAAGPQLTIPGGADPSTSEIWLGTDSGGTAQWRILQGSLTYSNKLIFRSVLGGSSVDQMTLTPTTSSIVQPLGVGGAANTSYKLYVQGGASNFSNSTTVPASSVLVGNFSSTFASVYSANSDPTDSGRWIQLYNSNATTTAGIQVCQSFHIIGGSIATRVINDLKAIRETVNLPNGAFVLTGRTNATGSIVFRDYAYFGYNKAFISPGAGNPVTIGSQTAPTSGYQVAIGTAGGSTDGSLEVNGNMIVRGAAAAPFTIEGSSTSTFVVNTDISDSLRFARITNTSTDTTAGVMSGLSFRVGPTSASPVQCDLVVSRDGASTRGGFSLNSKDASSGTGYWTMASFTPRLISITPDWSGYGSGIAGITLNSRFTPSAGYAVAVGSPGSYNTDGALEVAGNALFRGTVNAQGTTLSSLTVTGSSTLGDATSDVTSVSGKLVTPLCTKLAVGSGATNAFTTKNWECTQGCSKASAADATQKVDVTWRVTLGTGSTRYTIQGRDELSSCSQGANIVGESTLSWCATIKAGSPHSLVQYAGSISTSGTIYASSGVVTLTLVSGSTYDLNIQYTYAGIVAGSDAEFTISSRICARTDMMTDVSSYTVTPSA